ncbi:DUF6272 family protein [Aetokthonos hydrillicola Thurmond2011]|jgi:hypothetical protein|uniref:DUF6272 family protein n=1 Tax=Aetokthonos hydrillicola Thurmond2011 TaxID=2712845 RepID=A0AAP5I750_9CYAN|nr:DUF6272 family protein [Aetokthonos hydrillicola]MBO3458716.1 ATP-binding protein [Aetokthonos hydrillicola CCALA 1050]MBW4585465.1 ATP-binding protein [Aetokthonos hydrillicola CCALA 1050]MDR9896086.1 DUF6272 family protein [Aetokthonos hydrillicola Thurmond2011]
MSRIFGNFIDNFPQEYDSLEISFNFGSRLIQKRWKNNRLSAYFVADYLSNILPIDEDETQDNSRIEASKSTVTYIANELLENAMKFSEDNQVKFGIHFLEDGETFTAVIFTKNAITAQKAEKFQDFIKELLCADTHELYIQQIEKTAEDGDSEASGLGLLTIINDYSAKLGWEFDSDLSNLGMLTVTTMAQVII